MSQTRLPPTMRTARGAGPPDAEARARALRAAILGPELAFLMEAHDGVSAKIVEEAGFCGIWASGLAISTALGVRDSNEASWTQVLEVLEFMADATSLPILVDGDTGYGNFNNVRRLVRKLCQRGIAGVCIEDKLFPKTNSFLGEGQPLADIDEFCGKIKAAKDSQTLTDFTVVARIEALISGLGLDEALGRAQAYRAAGCDAILIHSKASSAGEILAFCREWRSACPVVIVPTSYYGTPTEEYRKAGIAAVIWANHNLRASINAMREVSRIILRDQSVVGVESRIASMREVFRLAGNDELAEAEKRYLPAGRESLRALVIAASRGEELGPLTEDRPKCMIDINGQPLLRRLVSTFRDAGIRDVVVIRGYRKDVVDLPTVHMIDNDSFATTGEVASLACAVGQIEGECLVSYGDILFRRYILDNLLESEGDIVLAVDAMWRERTAHAAGRVRDLVRASRGFNGSYLDDQPVAFRAMSKDTAPADTAGEWIGLVRLSAKGAAELRGEIEAMRGDGWIARAGLPDLFNRLAARGVAIRVLYVTGHWLDVDDAFDLARARNFL